MESVESVSEILLDTDCTDDTDLKNTQMKKYRELARRLTKVKSTHLELARRLTKAKSTRLELARRLTKVKRTII